MCVQPVAELVCILVFCSGRARQEKSAPEVERGVSYCAGSVQRTGNACVSVSNVCRFTAFRAAHCSTAIGFSFQLVVQPISQWLD